LKNSFSETTSKSINYSILKKVAAAEEGEGIEIMLTLFPITEGYFSHDIFSKRGGNMIMSIV
jgi:hypothetical protein